MNQTTTIQELKRDLLVLLRKDAFKKGNFVLSSGTTSPYYLDGRVITLTPEGAYLTGSIIVEMIRDRKLDAVGGPTLGADPIAGAVGVISYLKDVPLSTFIVRKIAKEHGAGRRVEGPALHKGARALLVDDVATTGRSLIEAKQALDELGVTVDSALVIVDRCEGAADNLAAAGIHLESIFTIHDFGL